MKRKLTAMLMACTMIVLAFWGLAATPAAWASEADGGSEYSPGYEELKEQMDKWWTGELEEKPDIGAGTPSDGPTITGSFYLNGDAENEQWFELHDGHTGVHYVYEHWFKFNYEISGSQIKCRYLMESRIWEITILDENRLQYQLSADFAPEVYTRLEGVEDDRLRRRPDDDFWDWYNRLPYEEQMKVLEEDLEREGQAIEQEKAKLRLRPQSP